VVDPGVKYAEPAIGRVIAAPESRGTGLGRRLMQQGIQRCEVAWPGRGIRISAQAHLQRFYSSLGFMAVGEPYLEDDIPHLEMVKAIRLKEQQSNERDPRSLQSEPEPLGQMPTCIG
jgi:ElaA protein